MSSGHFTADAVTGSHPQPLEACYCEKAKAFSSRMSVGFFDKWQQLVSLQQCIQLFVERSKYVCLGFNPVVKGGLLVTELTSTFSARWNPACEDGGAQPVHQLCFLPNMLIFESCWRGLPVWMHVRRYFPANIFWLKRRSKKKKKTSKWVVAGLQRSEKSWVEKSSSASSSTPFQKDFCQSSQTSMEVLLVILCLIKCWSIAREVQRILTMQGLNDL